MKPGRDPDDVAQAETDHFGNCPVCGALPLIDMRDLAQVLVHVHDAEIKIGESPEPPPLLKKRYGLADCTTFQMSDDIFRLRLSNIYGAVHWQGVLSGTIAMGDLILVLSIFAVGAGCGYYLRDRISKKRHERYLASKQSKRSRNTIGSYLRYARPRPRVYKISDASADYIAGFTGAELDGIGDATSLPSRHDQI